MFYKAIILFIFMLLTSITQAAWLGPDVVNSFTYGTEEFSVSEKNVLGNNEPDLVLTVDKNGRVYLGDRKSNKLIIYDSINNSYIKILYQQFGEHIAWPESINIIDDEHFVVSYGDLHQIYNYDGGLHGSFEIKNSIAIDAEEDGIIISVKGADGKYIKNKYSIDGTLIKGNIDQRAKLNRNYNGTQISDFQYRYDISIKDMNYTFISAVDTFESLYLKNGIIEALSKSDSFLSAESFDLCGKYLGNFSLPIIKIEENPSAINDTIEYIPSIIELYGGRIIGSDGNVYAWQMKRDALHVLKWTWVDSPDDPKGGPDAPADLKVAPVTTGLYLTWTASPQDPGCVEGYEVERSSTSGGIFSNIATTAPGVVSYSDTGVLPGSSAFYRVRAKSSCGPSDYTAVVGGMRP